MTHPLPPDQWLFVGAAPFTGRDDHRGLLQVRHPWVESHEGASGQWQADAQLPSGLSSEPVYLSFYESDNYQAEPAPADNWVGAQVFRGHRFKQLLVNGEVVWEADVADQEVLSGAADGSAPTYADPYRVVDITAQARALPPGEPLRLAFRVLDKVGSAVVLPGDAYYRFRWGTSDPAQSRQWFHTEVFFGDVCLTSSPEAVRPPSRHIGPPPGVSAAGAFPPGGIALELRLPGKLPRPGFPVRCGVPLPMGLVSHADSLGLLDPAGRTVPAVVTATSRWRDGSVRWALCEFVAAQPGIWRLAQGVAPAAGKSAVRLEKDESGLTVTSGDLAVRFGADPGEGLFEEVALGGEARVGAGRLSLKLNRVGWTENFTGRRHSLTIESADEVRAIIRLTGDMISEQGVRFGPWAARVQVWAGLPYVLVEWGLVHEGPHPVEMALDWSARLALPDTEGMVADFGPFRDLTDRELDADWYFRGSPAAIRMPNPRALPVQENSYYTCRQDELRVARVLSEHFPVGRARQAPGYVRLVKPGQTLVGAMRWLAEEFPKGLQVTPDELSLAVIPESGGSLGWWHDAPYTHIGRGEAKRQVFALWVADRNVSPAEAGRFVACLNDPPHLLDRAWFLDSQAAETGPAAAAGEVGERWEQALGPVLAWSGIDAPRLGHREYWDTAWMNNYRSRALAGLHRYLETADPRWRRYFDAACRHLRDVDVIHHCPEHPEWVGSIHQWAVDHTSGPATHNIGLGSDDLLDHWLVTGDADSLDAAADMAEFILQCETWSRSARAVGWPLAQVIRWYDQTADERYLRKAQEFLAAARAFIEPRRGIFDEMHGNWNYHGSVPFMTAYLAYGLIRHHQVTGDEEAARLLCLLADGVIAECATTPGRFRYSPFPECNLIGKAASTCGWSVNLGGLFGYAYLVTGDEAYRSAAQDCLDEVLANPREVSLDMVQLHGWLLRALADGGGREP